jgi:DNA-binding response OmpR family regulator
VVLGEKTTGAIKRVCGATAPADTRAQLLDEVWGRGTNVTDRVVDNQVTNLRNKIEPSPERPRYLLSLRGLGYRFESGALTEP